jgi:iron(II)-dependent oxidoreductase
MTSPQLLGQLNSVNEMMVQIVRSVPEADCYRLFHTGLAPLAWYLGRSVYQETYWLREVIQGDDDLTSRVRELFHLGDPTYEAQWERLPPRDHLLNWALEIQEENLTRLANPGMLPDHPLLHQERIQQHILQEHHRIYEAMLVTLAERNLLQDADGYGITTQLQSQSPAMESVGISQGHYRIGAKVPASAYDNELPEQVVELSSFRIARQPVSNAVYLRFMEEDGYGERSFWSDTGWDWLLQRQCRQPHHWRRDEEENWYAMGLNGPFDLVAEDPVMGINHHEATAFAAWLAEKGEDFTGAVLQHEYQWEVAVRTQVLQEYGRIWEWCSNSFHPYAEFQPAPDGVGITEDFNDTLYSLRGASLYTQGSLRRPSYRNRSLAENRYLFTGTRLVFPPKD